MMVALARLYFVAVIVLLMLYPLAHAQQHVHPNETIDGAAARLYSTWDRIDMPGSSCCSDKDCYATAARMIGGVWFARRREDGQWMRIDPSKVETRFGSPDGQTHLCAAPPNQTDAIFCFLPGDGT